MTSRNHHQVVGWFVAASFLFAWNETEQSQVEVFVETQLADTAGDEACPIWRCGFNSAELFGTSLHELNLDGEPNFGGLRLLKVTPPARLIASGHTRLGIENDALVLTDSFGDKVSGAELVGTTLQLGHAGVPRLDVEITAHRALKRWTPRTPTVDSYTMVIHEGELRHNLCSEGQSDPTANSALILGGETYDRMHKVVQPDRPRWFSIACTGSAVAKMAMFGYGPQTSDTTPQERQATLKMITADYCGSGTSYTRTGVPVIWKDRAGQISVAGESSAIEALWSEAGALCLDKTRLAGIDVACELPSCDGFALAEGMWVSRVPR